MKAYLPLNRMPTFCGECPFRTNYIVCPKGTVVPSHPRFPNCPLVPVSEPNVNNPQTGYGDYSHSRASLLDQERAKFAAKDAEIAELKARLNDFKRQAQRMHYNLADKNTEIAELKDALKDASHKLAVAADVIAAKDAEMERLEGVLDKTNNSAIEAAANWGKHSGIEARKLQAQAQWLAERLADCTETLVLACNKANFDCTFAGEPTRATCWLAEAKRATEAPLKPPPLPMVISTGWGKEVPYERN